MDAALLAYLPMDRRHALAEGRMLPERTTGAALFADISGFTPLTEALARTLGARRGAEELLRHLNRVYDALVDQVHAYGGSVIGFAGDSITCWFDGDSGEHATTCALAMQEAMHPFAEVALPSGELTALTIKVAVATGPVRRLLAGDPHRHQMEVLAGQTLARLADAEQLAQKGDIVLDEPTVQALGERLQIREWRSDTPSMTRVAVVVGVQPPAPPSPWPPLRLDTLTEVQVRPWLLPGVYARLREGQGEFLTELRPAVALFLRFGGLEFDEDEAAGRTLDQYLRWVQAVLARYEGTLLQLTMGDKGSYFYAAFGVPVAHEDDAERAVSAALELRDPPPAFGLASVQIGISRGTMRTGACGGRAARTYGSLGDEVNLAARLMQQAAPGQVLASGRIQHATEALFRWQGLPPVLVKGKRDPIPLFALLGERPRATIHLQEPTYTLPMVGRQAELAHIEGCMEQALAGRGQIVGITGEAGMGKSRLVTEVVRRATARGLTGYGGECQSYGTNIPYLVWQPIWRGLFDLDPTSSLVAQEEVLARALSNVDPALLPRLPLLGPLLGLPLAENDLTRSLDAAMAKASREGLLVDVLRARAAQVHRRGGALLLVLEDVHWLDPLSHDLLESLGQASATMPLLVVLAYRPPELARLQSPRVTRLPHFSEARLTELPPAEMGDLIQGKVGQLSGQAGRSVPAGLLQELLARAEGLPFYAEELLNYLHDQGLDPWQEGVLDGLELPGSLHSLVLSRMDQLAEAQKTTIKVASVIGRVFSFRWLLGYYPALGTPAEVRTQLEELRRLDLTPLEQPEPELTYLFKHIVTQEVAYESLPYARRATLHEQFARYLEDERNGSPYQEPSLDLLAYHYERSENLAKKKEYLRRAAEAAQRSYANQTAIEYYQRLLPLLDSPEQRAETLIDLGEVLRFTGQLESAETHFRQALPLIEAVGAPLLQARCQRSMGRLMMVRGDYSAGVEWLEQARAGFEALGDRAGWSLALSEIGYLLFQQGDYPTAQVMQEESLALGQDILETRDLTRILNRLGLVAHRCGDHARAEQLFEECVRLARDSGDALFSTYFLGNLGMVVGAKGELARAQALYEEILLLKRQMGDKWNLAVTLNNLGYTLLERNDLEAAATYLEESLQLRRELGDNWAINECLCNLGLLAIWQENYALARSYYEESVRLALALDDQRQGAYGLIGLAGVLVLADEAPANPVEQATRALRLLAAAESLLQGMGAEIESVEALLYQRVLEQVHLQMDESSFATARMEGQRMTLVEAVAVARAI